jgi:hypothetical protein
MKCCRFIPFVTGCQQGVSTQGVSKLLRPPCCVLPDKITAAADVGGAADGRPGRENQACAFLDLDVAADVGGGTAALIADLEGACVDRRAAGVLRVAPLFQFFPSCLLTFPDPPCVS